MTQLVLSIALVLAFVAGSSTKASADVEIETKTDVVKIEITVDGARNQQKKVVRFDRPTATVIKPCVDNPLRYACVYRVLRGGAEEEEVATFRTDRGYVQTMYTFAPKRVAGR